jgi:hypothetical protein
MREMLPELKQLPGMPWNRIASEMRANIQLGLVAGERRQAEAPCASRACSRARRHRDG